MIHLNLDSDGFLLSASYTTSGGPQVKNLDGVDLSGNRLQAYRWDGENLVLDQDRLYELEKASAAEKEETERKEMEIAISKEITFALITSQINTLNVDASTALRWKSFYPEFESIVGKKVPKGFKFRYGGKLWRVVDEITIQSHYLPGVGTESLYEEINEQAKGTQDDPIPYSGNMTLESGKHYSQDGVLYVCTRNSGAPVYHSLKDLVGLYVEIM